ncbi:2-polyprenyl-6-methoxyphenol hydroxylase-like FAD-dependent oxidoreductase [Kibdelosporangium banguiense]|uniref:2-polyprenyl-6-methoxyphenol hydroxylase-like FAD-dependent oxidoreductase n=1 Tax=Kibdelosporangium banguiense TaxID=1365924 RepID=A0ABS4TT87_9PSEU|nr:FAD-dependent monooxygenase [Kibdelosporangium banguiense]MBP2327610.1 2-polyprenyl-6-methoxyphenol hydroxylase-like FAD-dependent oxidoreductase [Kibdelosporangium banguiense]
MSNVLISGASVAGPALAYWLRRHGMTPTIVERAPGIRPGGQAIDVRGVGLTVVDRMGLLDAIGDLRTHTTGMSFVDADGAELMRSTEETLTGGVVDNEDIEILKSDLSEVLYDATRDDVEHLFGDSIAGLTQDDEGVTVAFERGAGRRFDYVIGADGLHSTVRSLVFGPESQYLTHLDTYLAVFTVPNFLGLDRWQTFHQTEGGLAGVYTTRTNDEVRAFLGFESPLLDFDHRDLDQQRKLVADRFAGAGWQVPRLLAEMMRAPDFYFDAMGQIRMPTWSSGRVSLVGDAAYCGSPLSGQGTTMALVGAYVLAGEMAYGGGFAAYEQKMRGFVAANQDVALAASRSEERRIDPETMRRISNGITLPVY